MVIVKRNKPKPAGKVSEDEMIQEITIENGKVAGNLPLIDGTYVICVISNKERTRKEWEMYWFQIIDSYCLHSGNDRYEIHDMFKEHYKIGSTKELQTDQQWQAAVNALKAWTLINS